MEWSVIMEGRRGEKGEYGLNLFNTIQALALSLSNVQNNYLVNDSVHHLTVFFFFFFFFLQTKKNEYEERDVCDILLYSETSPSIFFCHNEELC